MYKFPDFRVQDGRGNPGRDPRGPGHDPHVRHHRTLHQRQPEEEI